MMMWSRLRRSSANQTSSFHFSIDAVPEDLLESCLPILLRRINPNCELGRREKPVNYRSSPKAPLCDRVCSWG